MSEINQQITKCLTFIKNHVTDVGSVADKLCEKGVLKMSERESIVGIKSPREQIQGILDIVTKREKGDVFIAVLNETQNEHVAKEITSMEIIIGHTDLDRSKTYTKDHAETKEPEPKVLKELANANLEIERIRNLQANLREQLEEKHTRITKLHMKCNQLENEKTKLITETAEKTENQQEITQLKTAAERFELELSDKNKEIKTLYEKLSDIEDKHCAENAQIKTDITKLQSENADIKRVHEETSRQVSELMTSVSQLTVTALQLSAMVANLTENVSQLKAPVSQLVDTVSQLKEAVSQLTGIRKPKQIHKPIQPWRGGTKANPVKSRYT